MQGAADLVHALAQHPAYARMSGDLRLLLSRLPELDLTAAAVRAVLDMPRARRANSARAWSTNTLGACARACTRVRARAHARAHAHTGALR